MPLFLLKTASFLFQKKNQNQKTTLYAGQFYHHLSLGDKFII